MKYNFLSTLLFVCYTSVAQSALPSAPAATSPEASRLTLQAPPEQKATHPPLTSLGIRVGGALTQKAGDKIPLHPRTTFLRGGVVGLYRTVPFKWSRPKAHPTSVTFYFQHELLFSMQGYRLLNAPTQYDAKLRMYYVCLPLLITAFYHNAFLTAGLQGGYMMRVRERYDHAPSAITGATVGYSFTMDGYQRAEAAYVAGIGYRATGGLGVEARYVRGLTSLYSKGTTQFYGSDRGQQNESFQLQLSYPLIK